MERRYLPHSNVRTNRWVRNITPPSPHTEDQGDSFFNFDKLKGYE
jgi:hypothetical protein